MKIIKRMKAPTPRFFRVLRTIGLSLAAVGATVLTAPVVLPAALTTLAGYVTLAGSVLTAASQAATYEQDPEMSPPKPAEKNEYEQH